MFPKEIISVYLPKKVEGPRRFMLTKSSDLQTAVYSMLSALEIEVNKRLNYFMYDIQDKMDYLIDYNEDSPFYFNTISQELGQDTLEKEIKQSFNEIPNYILDEKLSDNLAEFMFNWVREKSKINFEKGLNSINTGENQIKITQALSNFEFQEDVLILVEYNEKEIVNFFEIVISQMKELAPNVTSYLEKHGYFREVKDTFMMYLQQNNKEEVYICDSKDIVFI